MEAFEAIRTLLAVRRYLDRPVPETIVRKIVEAGRLTGSAMNLQPWHFIVIQDRGTLRRLGALARSGPYIAEAPLAIVVVVEQTGYAVSDASRAIQSMLLVAWSEGILQPSARDGRHRRRTSRDGCAAVLAMPAHDAAYGSGTARLQECTTGMTSLA